MVLRRATIDLNLASFRSSSTVDLVLEACITEICRMWLRVQGYNWYWNTNSYNPYRSCVNHDLFTPNLHLSSKIKTTEFYKMWFELNICQSYRFKWNKFALNRNGQCVGINSSKSIPLQNQNWASVSHITSKAENSNIRWNWEVSRK